MDIVKSWCSTRRSIHKDIVKSWYSTRRCVSWNTLHFVSWIIFLWMLTLYRLVITKCSKDQVGRTWVIDLARR
jgi:hypothetical protein